MNNEINFFSGVLTSRLLGQKKNRDDSLSTTTVQEFLLTYPNLHNFMLNLLKTTVSNTFIGERNEQTVLGHPGLFFILTLLAKLACGPSVDQSLR